MFQLKEVTVSILLLCALAVSAGCSSTASLKASPPFKDAVTGLDTNFYQVTWTDVNSFAPSTVTSFILECTVPISDLKGMNEVEMFAQSLCKRTPMVFHDSGSGAVAGLGSAAISSAGMVGSGYFIGEGLGNSGGSTLNSTSNANGSPAVSQGSEHGRSGRSRHHGHSRH